MSYISIVGSEGIVGGALKFGFEMLGHQVKCHDIKLKTKLNYAFIEPNITEHCCFICVPTPKNDDGTCDTSIVEEVVDKLIKLDFKGIIVIKSTVSIGTTEKLIKKYNKSYEICFNPEFLKEKSALIDFTERQDLCIIGTHGKKVYKTIKKVHGHFPKKFVRLTPTEAEAAKYFNNTLGATLVTFGNSFYELCQKYNINYTNIKNAMANRNFVPKEYLEVNSKWRSWAGACWSKDVIAAAKMCEGTPVEFFQHLVDENEKYPKTVPPGMREQ